MQEDENEDWRKIHGEEVHSLYRSSNVVRVNKSGRLGWAVHVAKMDEGMCAFKSFNR